MPIGGVFKKTRMIALSVSLQRFYPGNYMRNIAINQSATRSVFYNDADFITDTGAYERIKRYVEQGQLDEKQVKHAHI